MTIFQAYIALDKNKPQEPITFGVKNLNGPMVVASALPDINTFTNTPEKNNNYINSNPYQDYNSPADYTYTITATNTGQYGFKMYTLLLVPPKGMNYTSNSGYVSDVSEEPILMNVKSDSPPKYTGQLQIWPVSTALEPDPNGLAQGIL